MSEEKNNVVVAQLEDNVEITYSCISSSPDARLVVMGGQDTIRIVSVKPSGLKEVRSVRISQYFQASQTSNNQGKQFENFRDMFSNAPAPKTALPSLVNISDVSWSICQTQNDEIQQSLRFSDTSLTTDNRDGVLRGEILQDGGYNRDNPFDAIFSMPGDLRMADDSLVAVAGSNGVVLVWRARDLLSGLVDQKRNNNDVFKQYGNKKPGRIPLDAPSSIGLPEAILSEHTKAAKVAWHPRLPGVLLTASLDGTANIWLRTANINPNANEEPGNKKWGWLNALSTAQFNNAEAQSFSWKCDSLKYKPNSEAIRDIKWSPFNDDLFAMVTSNGFLIVYNRIVPHRPVVRIAAHAGEATTLDWHPTKPYMIATGGVDYKVKVWDLDSDLNHNHFNRTINNLNLNERTQSSNGSSDSEGLDHSYHGLSSPSSKEQMNLNRSVHGAYTVSASLRNLNDFGVRTPQPPAPQTGIQMTPRRERERVSKHVYELAVAEQVEKLRWRPPKRSIVPGERSPLTDKHEAMLAVATTVGGATGGHGKVYLWSYHRSFMPLSIVDGHKEKCVADFIWLDTPEIEEWDNPANSLRGRSTISRRSPLPDYDDINSSLSGTWQHILTVGKDGKCLVQSFCRGERPISRVPPSAFALTELSPFQKGYGSLQLIAAHQNVPSGRKNEYALCGFRRGDMAAQAPGIFKEEGGKEDEEDSKFEWDPNSCSLKDQNANLELTFSTADHGDIKDILKNIDSDKIGIAPEVVHISRFADGYKLRRDATSRTKGALCRHNAGVAKKLNCLALARMWTMLASLVDGSGSDDLSDSKSNKGFPKNALSFAFLPTLKTLLLERADAGDVQTCVIVCEVMEVIPKPKTSITSSRKTPIVAVPGLDLVIVRQWYLSYIELLQQMCLFSHATNLIRLSNDPEISKRNQQSTNFHMSCSTCLAPLEGEDASCKKCRQKVGLCFLCHEPVKGIYVWCPGCGHGGHLEHALDWFGGTDNPLREMCPTGCGHRCNSLIRLADSSKTQFCEIVRQ